MQPMKQPLFDPQKLRAKEFKQDDLGLLFVLYELWEQYPERFGDNEIARLNAKQRIAQTIENPKIDKFKMAEELVQCFTELGIQPFKDISIINISPVQYHKDSWEPLTRLCAEYRSIAESIGTDSEIVTIKNIGALTKDKKADFVITGNVVNYIQNDENRQSFMRAAAMATKKDGRTIHLMDLDNDFDKESLNQFMKEPKHYEAVGQQFLRTIPEGRQREQSNPLAAIAAQLRELGPDGQIPPDSKVDIRALGLRGRIQDPDGKQK